MIAQPSLPSSEEGAATIEFALLTLFFFLSALLTLDVASYYVQRSQLAQAVSAGSMSAFANRSAVPYQSLPGYIQNAARLPSAPQVRIGCNGVANGCVNTGRSCACLSKAGGYSSAVCGSSCPAGTTPNSTAGYYMQITASSQYRAMVLPNGMLNGTPITQSVTVRLE
ncbi:TadE/TadG family type IV pilus assembly protein [Sphingomonas pituitosa]|uniref:TadE/TadG family type IV pilus assembly protein n=1 Tax=Sphingomonas pituitosa TaxID=99597 RepID=UPI000831136A|nr:TadE/TadG family type IV pilus assembly protein [Sphingomonas pituitosa]